MTSISTLTIDGPAMSASNSLSINKPNSSSTSPQTDVQQILGQALDGIPLGIIVVTNEGAIVTVNEHARQLAGLVGFVSTIEEVDTAMGDNVSLRALFDRCLEDKEEVTVRNVKRDPFVLAITISPIKRRQQSGLAGISIVIQDTTEAAVLAKNKDEFVSIAAHELRTPLMVISNSIAMIRDYFSQAVQDATVRQLIDNTTTAAKQLSKLVNDFLQVSRLERGKIAFERKPVDIKDLASIVVKELAPLAIAKNLSLSLRENTAPVPMALVDYDKTKEVFVNVVGNAIKYTQNGKIEIRVVHDMEKLSVKVTVSDTGKGITPKQQTILFRKFGTGITTSDTSDTTKSTGLGLYITKLLIEGMGGTISLESSKEGEGSTFAIYLPASHQH